jgi:hypothetical protein
MTVLAKPEAIEPADPSMKKKRRAEEGEGKVGEGIK